jgi:hypothetical protein
MPELLQDVIVTLFAAGAAWIIVKRVFSFVNPAQGRVATCDSCPSGQSNDSTTNLEDGLTKPLTLVRERRR